jgi:calcineurin-like phosphoesterase family protein
VSRFRALLLLVGLLVPAACKPIRYLVGWTPKLAADTALRVGGAVLVGAGDIGYCGLPGASATAILLDQIPGTVFAAGDLAYPDGSADDFARCYAPSWGRHFDRTRPTPGNHEYEKDTTAADYFRFFGDRAGEPGKGYYSYELGAWHVVVINSNIDVGVGSAQEQWLRADLQTHKVRCTVAYWHHTLFSSSGDSTPRMRAVWQALYEAGADVVVAGHHHAYERFAPQAPGGILDTARGIRSFVVGTGGAGLDYFKRAARHSERRYNDNYGVLKLELYTDHYRWQFISANGHLRDSGDGRCH